MKTWPLRGAHSKVSYHPLYSWRDYPEAGTAQLDFFQEVGHVEKTNMYLGGCLPSGYCYVVEGVELLVCARQELGEFLLRGVLELRVLNRTVFTDGPLLAFTPEWKTGPRENGIYNLKPRIELYPAVHFGVYLRWAEYVPLRDARICARLTGYMQWIED